MLTFGVHYSSSNSQLLLELAQIQLCGVCVCVCVWGGGGGGGGADIPLGGLVYTFLDPAIKVSLELVHTYIYNVEMDHSHYY